MQLDPPVNLSPSHRIFLIGALYTVLVQHVVAKRPLHPTAGPEGPSPDLAYWLSRPAAERIEDLSTPGQVIQLGDPPARIDLLTSIDGVGFRQACERRQVVKVDGIDLPFISLEDFKTNKRASGRLKDLADLERLGEAGDGSPA